MNQVLEARHLEEVSRNPYSVASWWRYIDFAIKNSIDDRKIIYERALLHLPRSYKIWKAYLSDICESLIYLPISSDHEFNSIISCFEAALHHLNKMPQIWLRYCRFLSKSTLYTKTRRTFDRALQSLPITQHGELWDHYIAWAKSVEIRELTIQVYQRYLMFDPTAREGYISFLASVGIHDEAVKHIITLLDANGSTQNSPHNRNLWDKFIQLCVEHSESISAVTDVESIMRRGLRQFSDENGKLWCMLAEYYVRLGLFGKAFDIFEEALTSIRTIRDFTIVFDSYVRVEESIITELMKADDSSEVVDMRLAKLEFLVEKRPLWLNAVCLRQNPNNVYEWQKRLRLLKSDPAVLLVTFVEALKTVDSRNAVGKLNSLWIMLADHYETANEVENARSVYSKASRIEFKNVDELATIWCAWAEFEIRHDNVSGALSIMRSALKDASFEGKRRHLLELQNKSIRSGRSSIDLLSVNTRVWSFYLDLEENLGSLDTCRAAYDQAFDLNVMTVTMALNYAAYLEKSKYFEEAFRVFERSLAKFNFPEARVIWEVYLDRFIARHARNKLERLRDLFEQLLSNVSVDYIAEYYVKYAKVEEEFGFERHAISIYDRATRVVPSTLKLDMYKLYIKKVELYFGVMKTRSIFDRAIAELDELNSRLLCIEYSSMEAKLGEIDRARAVLRHGSQFSDPKRENDYWHHWKSFEEAYGNEDTFRDMLRVKRSVEAAYSQVNYVALDAAKVVEDNLKKRKIEEVDYHVDSAVKVMRSIENVSERTIPATVFGQISTND